VTELSPEESRRRAAALEGILLTIANAPDDQSDWWNMTRYPELGDRTPTRAWLDGDHELVEKLVASWYAASEVATERHRNDPEFMEMIRTRSSAFAERRTS
jgi:hypothetical protein